MATGILKRRAAHLWVRRIELEDDGSGIPAEEYTVVEAGDEAGVAAE